MQRRNIKQMLNTNAVVKMFVNSTVIVSQSMFNCPFIQCLFGFTKCNWQHNQDMKNHALQTNYSELLFYLWCCNKTQLYQHHIGFYFKPNGTGFDAIRSNFALKRLEQRKSFVVIVSYGLKHGLATRPKESDILAYAGDIWEQIDKANICNNNFHSKSKIENALRGLAFNLINIVDSRIYKDTNHIKVIKQLRKYIAILKTDKDNGCSVT